MRPIRQNTVATWYRREEPECGIQTVSAVDITENQELITGI